jgi:hypothetical protein
LINYLNDVQAPPYGLYSEDIDRSGTADTNDISKLNALLSGTSKFISWVNKTLPSNSCGGDSLMGGGGGESEAEAVETMIDELVVFLASVAPVTEEEWSDLATILNAVGECIETHVGSEDACELAGILTSEETSYANEGVNALAVEFAGEICS